MDFEIIGQINSKPYICRKNNQRTKTMNNIIKG